MPDRVEDAARFGPQIGQSVEAASGGLLLQENFVYSLFPVHVGMRQYWRDLDTLLKVDALRSAWRVVEAVLARLRRNGVLARDLPDARQHGG